MRPTLLAALATTLALIACTPKTPEGARCDDIGGTGHCPVGQRCGADGTCSVAAMECTEICSATTCNGSELNKCMPDAVQVCAHVEQSTCGPRQECHADVGACECPLAGCGDFRECSSLGDGGTSCECKPNGGCTQVGSKCSQDGAATIACQEDDGCLHPLAAELCPDPGMTCSGVLPDASCKCPAAGSAEGDGCGQVAGVASCNGTTLLTCQPKAQLSSCNVWRKVEDCSLAGLACSASGEGACVCPALPPSPRTIYADSTASRRGGLVVSGAQTPLCRFARLADAVAVATSGDTVQAVGVVPVLFVEPAFTVPANVTLTTSDTTPAPLNFPIEPDGSVGSATLVTLRPGATLRGFEVRNVAATGSGIATSCPDLVDTAETTVESVNVQGLGTGSSPTRFVHGLSHSGRCSLAVRNSLFEGASDSGIHVLSQSTSATLTLTGNTVQRNKGSTAYRINGIDRLAGGIALRGSTPSTTAFTGNRVVGNEGDQVVVFMAGTLSLAGADCGASSNVLACYVAPGVGISTAAASVDVTNTTFDRSAVGLLPDQDYVVAVGSTLGGITQACSAFSGSCPAPP